MLIRESANFRTGERSERSRVTLLPEQARQEGKRGDKVSRQGTCSELTSVRCSFPGGRAENSAE